MAINQPQQFARLIADLASGGSVSLAAPDAELGELLAPSGVTLKDYNGQLAVASAPLGIFPNLSPLTETVLAGPAGDLPLLLKEAAANGFLPDMSFAPPEFARDWILLRRTDSHLNLHIDSLTAAAIELETERQHLQQRLKDLSKEVRTMKTSPAWLLIGRYREWLENQRKSRTLAFRVYNRVVEKLVRQSVESLGVEKFPDPPLRPLAAATRFTIASRPVEDWRRTFRGLAAHAGIEKPSDTPAFSIVTPLWNTKPLWLAEAAVSVFDQTMTDWEWCLVDDCSTDTSFTEILDVLTQVCPRVRFTRLPQNGGISAASNEGLAMARGKYVCFLDHDDLLHPEALEVCLEKLEQGFDAVYTDSDKASEEGICDEPFYKPDWSPEYFRGVMYIGHLLCTRRDGALEVGGFDSSYNGVQDYEFFLRFSERFHRIGHITRVLYHWRRVEGSIAASGSAKKNISQLQRRAVAAHLDRLHIPAAALPGATPHRVIVSPLPSNYSPRVSILIPTKNAPEMLSKCLESIFRKSTYKNFQLVCADNDTTNPQAIAQMRRPGVERLACPGRFNYSKVNNEAAAVAGGEYLIFLNNDIEVISPDWIEQLLFHAQKPDVGAVGALLVYPDQRVQHCGVALGFRGTADHLMRGIDSTSDGYAGALAHAHECAAVTAACLMMRKDLFHEIGGFNEHYFHTYQDVDLCLRLLTRGLRNVYTPLAKLYHHESYSRGSTYDWVDRMILLDTWEELIEAGDPYFNVNFDRVRTDYQIAHNADRGQLSKRVELWTPSLKLPALAAASAKSR